MRVALISITVEINYVVGYDKDCVSIFQTFFFIPIHDCSTIEYMITVDVI